MAKKKKSAKRRPKSNNLILIAAAAAAYWLYTRSQKTTGPVINPVDPIPQLPPAAVDGLPKPRRAYLYL